MFNISETKVYVASRASIPERPAMWRALRNQGWKITSTWIDAGSNLTLNEHFKLWILIEQEIRAAHGLILYAEPQDFPIKGAYVEAGMALAMQKPVVVVLPETVLDEHARPLGSWYFHPGVCLASTVDYAREIITSLRPALG